MSEGEGLESAIRSVGEMLGLDAVGIADAKPTPRTEFVREWWRRGYGGEMDYIGRRLDERADPRLVLPEARSLIVVGLLLGPETSGTGDRDEEAGARGRVAHYAGGDDYHDVLLDRVRALAAALPALADGPVVSRCYVDTGPVLERAAAAGAGLGWIGKNSCLIHPDLGSHLMLGVILSDLSLTPDEPVADHCGTCRACLDVCPTDAFVEPYVLDATRCLSYTTIESKGAIPEELRAGQGDHVFGCDLCQSVCPWNKSRPKVWPGDPLGLRERLGKRREWVEPTLAWLLDLEQETFREATHKTAIRRPGFRGLMRNALVAAGNSGDASLLSRIDGFAEGDDEMLAEHARWARERLLAPSSAGERAGD